MKLNFRQGLISFQQAGSAPNFLIGSTTVGFVTLNIDPSPLLVTVAHGSSDYLLKFDVTISNAWGPMVPDADNYLYLQIDTITGVVTRGITTLEPITSAIEPIAAVPGQMWFDLTKTIMRVRTNDGAKWLDQPRLVLGHAVGGGTTTIAQRSTGSSVGLNVPSSPGYFLLDSQLRPLRTSSGELLTTDSPIRVNTTVGTSGVLSNPVNNFIPVRAAESIPAMRLVYFSGSDTISLASSDPSLLILKTPIGIVEYGLSQNETGVVTQSGEVTYDQWSWNADDIGKPVYCGWLGEITTTRPQSVQVFRVGYIKNSKTILFYIDSETQVLVISSASTLISAAAPIVAVTAPNVLNEIVTTISMLSATQSRDGYMTAVQAGLVLNFDTRITATENDIVDLEVGKADVGHLHAISNVTDLQIALDALIAVDATKSNLVVGATIGRFAALTSTGNLADSGFTGTSFAPAVHAHQISAIIGLPAALNLKSDVGHVHAISDVTNLQTELNDRAFANHTQSISSINNLQTALDGKAATNHTHIAENITDFPIATDARVTAMLVPGANISITQTLGTLVIASTSVGASLKSITITFDSILSDFVQYGRVTIRNGYDGDVGVSGYISQSNPFITSFSLNEINILTDPNDALAIANQIDWPFAAFSNQPVVGAGLSSGSTITTVAPISIGATNTKIVVKPLGTFYQSTFYFPMKNADELIMIGSNFTGYGQPWSVTVTVGPVGVSRETYTVAGSAEADPATTVTFTVTRTP